MCDRSSKICKKSHFYFSKRENIIDIIGGSKGGARDAPPPGGPNSFIFMQFSAKIINKHTHFGSWRPPWGKSWIRHWISYSSLFQTMRTRGRSAFIPRGGGGYISPHLGPHLPVCLSAWGCVCACLGVCVCPGGV